jgi:hypothetical protein
MHRCPSARSGVAKRQGRGAGRGIIRLAQAQRGKSGKPGHSAELHPCAARGAEPLRNSWERKRARCGLDTVRQAALERGRFRRRSRAVVSPGVGRVLPGNGFSGRRPKPSRPGQGPEREVKTLSTDRALAAFAAKNLTADPISTRWVDRPQLPGRNIGVCWSSRRRRSAPTRTLTE